MKIRIVSFTKQGAQLAERLQAQLKKCPDSDLDRDVEIANRQGGAASEKLSDWTKRQFEEKNALIFIGAAGIAVRAIAPCVQDKLADSPVLVMDEKGQYVIPILSGHVGGANELAEEIAKKTGALPIITTATDLNGKFAVDLFAKKNHLTILNREGIAAVSSKILEGEKATIAIEDYGKAQILPDTLSDILPKELEWVPYPPEKKTDIVISRAKEKVPEAVLQLKPKEYILGIGCRKGKSFSEIDGFITKQLDELQLTKEDIRAIASIDVKREEEGIVSWKDYYRVPFLTFSKETLQQVPGEFTGSSFVEQQVGVDNVCERAALTACEGDGVLIRGKQAENGMTLAVAKKKWSLEEER